ncbi:hypothetical protein HELRODRAFT_167209 [Helobdella robusta]|uniref:Uncharacterized protein n=1 Tax=Helobdella robusta TaxID=6412 RepID=T1EZ53_HELRO|nr:hypothetical protein HELRODRAFT_167209 [Helobdella robusta]ESO10715.1 hypothetical protein HELRODRAFT_167209 [Helobdella robusta]
MKERMSLQADEIKIYRDRVLRLQDQLIQKNDNEKRFLKKSSAGVKSSMKQSSSGSGNYNNDDLEKQLEDRITKVRSLEEAYRKQEKVIEKMELLIRQQNLSRVKKLESKISALESENRDLKKEVSDLKKSKNKNQFDQKQQHQHEKDRKNSSDADKNDDDGVRGDVTNDRNRNDTKRVNGLKMNGNLDNSRKFQKQTNVQDDDDADFSLKNKYEEAETRIKELEKQLSEATKMWSNEKTDLVAKLRNAEHSLYGNNIYRNEIKNNYMSRNVINNPNNKDINTLT